jgi:pilus assembly protein CpaF
VALLTEAIATQQNVLISGGTGTGKTTLLNALAACIPMTTGSSSSKRPPRSTSANPICCGVRRAQAPLGQEAPLPPVTIADLLRATLRHRPDRILVGEVRGPDAFDLLQALNTGHLGSLSTIHANSADQALTRLAHCVLTANVGLPHHSVREAIALAIHLVVHIARVNGRRRVTEITAIRGYDTSTDRFQLELRLLDRALAQEGAVA